jgi:hypothetical protein
MTFSDVNIGQKFYFKYGVRGERGPWRKVAMRSYVAAKGGDRKRWSVATGNIEVRR